jgi:hypothetical protein
MVLQQICKLVLGPGAVADGEDDGRGFGSGLQQHGGGITVSVSGGATRIATRCSLAWRSECGASRPLVPPMVHMDHSWSCAQESDTSARHLIRHCAAQRGPS